MWLLVIAKKKSKEKKLQPRTTRKLQTAVSKICQSNKFLHEFRPKGGFFRPETCTTSVHITHSASCASYKILYASQNLHEIPSLHICLPYLKVDEGETLASAFKGLFMWLWSCGSLDRGHGIMTCSMSGVCNLTENWRRPPPPRSRRTTAWACLSTRTNVSAGSGGADAARAARKGWWLGLCRRLFSVVVYEAPLRPLLSSKQPRLVKGTRCFTKTASAATKATRVESTPGSSTTSSSSFLPSTAPPPPPPPPPRLYT